MIANSIDVPFRRAAEIRFLLRLSRRVCWVHFEDAPFGCDGVRFLGAPFCASQYRFFQDLTVFSDTPSFFEISVHPIPFL